MIVYLITNKINGHRYIGQTIRSIKERWSEHCKYTSDCSAIARAIRKYRKENFTIEAVYAATSIEELNKKEQEFIKKFNTFKPHGYNLTTGGLNYIRSEETKRKFSEGQKGAKNHRFGKKLSRQVRQRMSKSRTGILNHFFGKTHTKASRIKMSESQKESLQERVHPRLGKTFSKTSRKKMSDSQAKRPVICNETNRIFKSVTEAAKIMGVSPCTIGDVLKGRSKTCKGFTFSYLLVP